MRLVVRLLKAEQLGLFTALVPVKAHTRATDHGPVQVEAHLRHQKVGVPDRVAHADHGEVRVSGYYDAFREHDAPYEWEERTSESGRSYSRKVYLPEAYTAEYMDASDETQRLVRWGVRLADGRTVSRDGVFRLRFPERWEAIRNELARVRGAKRDEAAARILWRGLTDGERKAMVASIPLQDYVDGRGLNQAVRDLEEDLQSSGSLLYWLKNGKEASPGADGFNPYDLLFNAYAVTYTGGPVGSDAWRTCDWHTWIRYQTTKQGAPVDETDPMRLPLISTRQVPGKREPLVVPHPWVGAVREFAANGRASRRSEIHAVRTALETRLGGPVTDWPEDISEWRPDLRRQQLADLDARIAKLSPDDRDAVRRLGYPGFIAILRDVVTLRRAE